MILLDVLAYAASSTIAFWIVYGTTAWSPPVITISLLTSALALPTHWMFGLYASIVRYIGLSLVIVGVQATFLVTASAMAVSAVTGVLSAPVRVGIVIWAFSLILIVGGRLAARMFLSRRNLNREPVIIYGAGEGGAQLAAALFGGDDYLPVAMIDDDSALHRQRIRGLKVHSPEDIEDTIQKTGARGVLLAIPSASKRRRRQVLERLSEFPVRVQTMPEIRDIVSGKAKLDDIRDVDVKDLLGRDPVPPIQNLLSAPISGKHVMVTGAGGSIGSELCRQILKLRPARLVCLDVSEVALYGIERNLKAIAHKHGIHSKIVPLLGSVHQEHRMQQAFEVFRIHTVYHAAAYKHVPIVEQNMFEGIHNNAIGTWHTARAATNAGVDNFVLISTDKAVNPTNIMGATKRLAELVLQAFERHAEGMRTCMVRFGNVLESSGSVVPLFREQIRNGGPVTVTHRDIIRYFMTIPEAAQLVIQAGAMARGGDVFVLDMGKPVRIEDLARRMIYLMGRTVRDKENPDGDIEIEYIGLRPAEKLYEELLIGSNVSGTEHPRILRADEAFLPYDVLVQTLDQLRAASASLDYERARKLLMEAVREYVPSNGIDDLLWTGTEGAGIEGETTIVDFPRNRP